MNGKSSISNATNYEEIAEFWDAHSLADYWDQTEEATFMMAPEAGGHYLVAVDPFLLEKLQKMAKKRGLGTESLINLFLQQQLQLANGA